LAVPKYFPSNFGNFKIKNPATHNCVKDWGTVALGKAGVGKPLAGLG